MKVVVLKCAILGAGFMGLRTYPLAIYIANIVLAQYGVRLELTWMYVRDKKKHARVQLQTQCLNITDDMALAINGADIVFNCLPNSEHRDPTIAALKAGKHVVCEKPLGRLLEDAQAIVDALKTAGTFSLCSLCYLGADAVRYGQTTAAAGKVFTPDGWFKAFGNFRQDWRIGYEADWRFQFAVAGPGGILDDLLQHVLSVLLGWVGPNRKILDVKADLEYIIGLNEAIQFFDGTDPRAKNLAVDAASAQVRFEGGSSFVLDTTRLARGRKAFSECQLHGHNGALAWQLHDGHKLQVLEYQNPGASAPSDAARRGFSDDHASGFDDGNYESVPGLTRGYASYFANMFAGFALAIVNNTKTPSYEVNGHVIHPIVPDFHFALNIQALTSAMLTSGYDGGSWKKVSLAS